MSDTNSFLSQELTADPPRSASDATANLIDTSGRALGERLGVGGMGEVHRFGDEALQRDLAIKILRDELRGNADAEERFLREARLTGSLQHPGVVPIHNLSRLADGRPCYTMKLVRGRTFADMLRDEPQGPERLPRLLAILEKVCQAVAYAHSKHVIHRDLKPSNVMVGEFGEVQVMDWGLAKDLQAGASTGESASSSAMPAAEGETGEWAAESEGLSRAGAALGTLAYMPPEQAAGDWLLVDERADVFALGAILCEILTGKPPYHGRSMDDLLRQARRGDMTEVQSRLQRCGADTTLAALCRECLSAVHVSRPRHAGVVAERLASYEAEVRERLQQAELQRVAAESRALAEAERAREAQARAAAERRARRQTLALAAAAGVLIAAAVGAWWWQHRQQEQTDQAVSNGLAQAELLADQARADPLQTDRYHQALEAAQVAAKLADNASAEVRRRAEELVARLDEEEKAAKKDRQLLAALLEVRSPREGPKYSRDYKGMMMVLAEPTVEEQFASAFRDWGLDVDAVPVAESAARLKARPAPVVTEVIAALDEWESQRRQDRKPEAARHLAELTAALDDKPGSLRRELREIMARGQLPAERALGMLSAALRPVPVPVIVPSGKDVGRLRRLAESINPAAEPVLGLLTLTRALRVAGEEDLAERLLRTALTARPREVAINHSMGQFLSEQKSSRSAEAIEFYRVARGLRPDLGVTLARALLHNGRADEGLELLAQLVKERPDNPYLHNQRGLILHDQGKYAESEDACHNAISLNPDYAEAYITLGAVLYNGQGKHVDAAAAFRKAITLRPDFADAYNKLGVALGLQGKHVEAEANHRKALALEPDFADPYSNLGIALNDQGKHVEAEAANRKAIALNPDFAKAYNSLAVALGGQGKIADAEAACRKAITLAPDFAGAYINLGNALGSQGKHGAAEAAFRKAIALKPDYAEAHCNLGFVLKLQGRFKESLAALQCGHELGSQQSGWRHPSLQWVRSAERFAGLEKRLPAILAGEESPSNPADALTLAWMCQQPYKRRYAAAARLYTDAFTADPRLADNLQQRHRYNAACSAALAAAGQGEHARVLPDRVAVMFRRWALRWLRGDLMDYTKLAEPHNPAANKAIQQRLAHWRRDPDLASVRDPQALDRLPADERAAWQALWRDVDELAKRAAKQNAAKK